MKRILGLLIAAFLFSGCASQGDYYKTVLAIESAKAQAETAKWKAVEAGMAKASPEGSAMAALAIALGRGGEVQATQLQAPQSLGGALWQAALQLADVGARVYGIRAQRDVGITQSNNAAATTIAGYGAFSSIAGAGYTATANIAGLIQAPQANVTTNTTNTSTSTTNTATTLSGTGVLGSGTYTGPVTTTTNPTPRICSTTATGALNCQGG